MPFDPDIHRRRSIRLPEYDYTQAGAYFVTLCTDGRACILDDPRIDRLVRRIWARTAGRGRVPREGDFVVMPNHIHGIVWIDARSMVVGAATVGASRPAIPHPHPGDGHHQASRRRNATVDDSPLRPDPLPAHRRAECGSLGALVGSFKANAAVAINKLRRTPGAPVWQRNYYERVVRDERELNAIREYIRDNPRCWAEDPDNPASQAQRR